jgi:hypothetical protein
LRYILCLCPAPEILNPCKCDAKGISCGGNDVINLKNIFKAIDQKLNESEKHFKKFYLNNTAITEIEENTLYDLTFDEIQIINATKLKLIHTNAFNATNLVTKKFSVNYDDWKPIPHLIPLTDSPPTHDIFHMLSSIISLEEIDLCYTNITQIPSNAFKPINGAQNNLTFITFENSSSIAQIGDNPFYYLNNLNFLQLSGTKIDSIPKNAFNFEKESKKKLMLSLQWTKLNGTGFQLGSLENLKRPTDIYLGDNPKQTYLDEQIFRPFLEANDQNVIRIDIFHVSYIDCNDCRSYWLKKESKYYNRTNLWICSNGYKSLYDNTSFAQCEHFF